MSPARVCPSRSGSRPAVRATGCPPLFALASTRIPEAAVTSTPSSVSLPSSCSHRTWSRPPGLSVRSRKWCWMRRRSPDPAGRGCRGFAGLRAGPMPESTQSNNLWRVMPPPGGEPAIGPPLGGCLSLGLTTARGGPARGWHRLPWPGAPAPVQCSCWRFSGHSKRQQCTCLLLGNSQIA